MVSIELSGENLIVRILGWHKLLAMRSSLAIPLRHIDSVRAHPSEGHEGDVIRNPWSGVGTYMRGKMAVGTVDLEDGRAFFDVTNPSDLSRAIALDLVHEPLKHVVVDLSGETPESAVRRIGSQLNY